MCQIERERESNCARQKGIPIGNLTSQIFSNIYLNELDRFIKHSVRPKAYLRYGDDFIIVADTHASAQEMRETIIEFVETKLRLAINPKHDILIQAKQGLKFLGVEIFPRSRILSQRNWKRSVRNLRPGNIASYRGLIQQHSNKKRQKQFDWLILDRYDEI